jgi:hypothetical protein
LTLDLTKLVSCEMYRDVGSMWDGITRWLYTVASVSVVSVVLLMTVVALLFLAPFLWLVYGLLLAQPAFGWEVLVVLQVMIVYLARFLASRRFSQPKTSVILHPIGIAFVILVAIYASYQYIIGAGVRWKGRVYGSGSQIT